MTYELFKFLHILTVVFMAIPLFNLIVVNERAMFGKAHLQVDLYFENIIRGGAIRCYVFQATALVTGLVLVGLAGPFSALVTNWVLAAKFLLLLALMGLLSLVHFSLQPAIDGLLRQVQGEAIPAEIAAQIAPLRLRRKRLAGTCLFLVIASVLLGMQIFTRFPALLTVVLLLLAGAFARRVYSSRIPYGWL